MSNTPKTFIHFHPHNHKAFELHALWASHEVGYSPQRLKFESLWAFAQLAQCTGDDYFFNIHVVSRHDYYFSGKYGGYKYQR